MANEMIKNLYYDYSSYHDDCIHAPEYREMLRTQRLISEKIMKKTGEDLYSDIDEFITETESRSMECGFILGFKYAMKLMAECAR